MKYQPLVPVAGAVCLGVVIDRLLPMDAWCWLGCSAAGLLLWWQLFRHGNSRSASAALLATIALSGACWHHAYHITFAADDVGNWAGRWAQPVRVRATLAEGPRRVAAGRYSPYRAIPQYDRTSCIVKVTALYSGARWQPASGRALLSVEGHLLGVVAGDAVEIRGILRRPQQLQNPGGIDWSGLLGDRRVRAIIAAEYPHWVQRSRVGRAAWWSVSPVHWLDPLRRWADGRLRQRLEERHYALAAALLLGAREHLAAPASDGVTDLSLQDAFVRTGTMHLLAISGLHVGIIAALLWVTLSLVGCAQRARAGWVAALVVGYALLTGARPPVVRAAVLVCAGCGGLFWFRKAQFANSLAAGLLLVVGLRPPDLFNTGLQLSFLAAAAFVWIGSRVPADLTSRSTPMRRLVQESQTLAEQVVHGVVRFFFGPIVISSTVLLLLWPLVLARFHILAPVALGTNLFILMLAGGVLLFGFAMLFFDLCMLGPAAAVFAELCRWCLELIVRLVEWGTHVPAGYFYAPGPPDWWLIGFYCGAGLYAAMPSLRRRRLVCRWLSALAVWIAVGLAASVLRPVPPGLRCTFLSMGHGLAVVLHLPDGRTLLYDAGNLGEPESAGRTVAEYLWSRGITRLDGIVLSHGDVDHFNAVPTLVERFSIGAVFVAPSFATATGAPQERDAGRQRAEILDGRTDGPRQRPIPAAERLLQLLEQNGIPVRRCWEGSELLTSPAVRMGVLHPPVEGSDEGDNAASIVLLVEHAGRRLLLTGDLEGAGMRRLLSGPPQRIDVLQAPHHGSANSHSPGLTAWAAPAHVVVSQRDARESADAMQAYRRAGIGVVSTGQWGAIEVTLAAEGVDVRALVPRR